MQGGDCPAFFGPLLTQHLPERDLQERKRRSVLKWHCSAGSAGLQEGFRGTATGTQVNRVEKYQIRDTWWSRDEHTGYFSS